MRPRRTPSGRALADGIVFRRSKPSLRLMPGDRRQSAKLIDSKRRQHHPAFAAYARPGLYT